MADTISPFKIMKKIIICIVFAFASLSALAGTVKNIVMPSEVLGVEKPVSVYLPDGYDLSEMSYPVLYLLHGAWGNNLDWVDKGSMKEIADLTIKSGKAVPMIIVMPDARGTGADFAGPHMGYFDQSGWEYEKYFYDELIPYIESNFRVVGGKNNRAIAGLSMGGGGSVAYGQNYPDYWGSVCALSAALGDFGGLDNSDGQKESRNGMAKYNQIRFVEDASPETVEKLRSIRWYVDCGDDDFLADNNVAFFRAMKGKKIPFEYRMRDGAHNWTYWRTALPEVLSFISIGFPH